MIRSANAAAAALAGNSAMAATSYSPNAKKNECSYASDNVSVHRRRGRTCASIAAEWAQGQRSIYPRCVAAITVRSIIAATKAPGGILLGLIRPSRPRRHGWKRIGDVWG